MLDQSSNQTKIKLHTIGYEGANIDDFVAALKVSDVKTLIDVRELPLSRKKGFSKNGLREHLQANNIAYIHVKQLGDPKPGRLAARAGNMAEFRRIFGKHIQLDESQRALQDIVPTILDGDACLLCFERCHSDCHRAIVAKELSKIAEVDLAHIGVRQGLAKQH